MNRSAALPNATSKKARKCSSRASWKPVNGRIRTVMINTRPKSSSAPYRGELTLLDSKGASESGGYSSGGGYNDNSGGGGSGQQWRWLRFRFVALKPLIATRDQDRRTGRRDSILIIKCHPGACRESASTLCAMYQPDPGLRRDDNAGKFYESAIEFF